MENFLAWKDTPSHQIIVTAWHNSNTSHLHFEAELLTSVPSEEEKILCQFNQLIWLLINLVIITVFLLTLSLNNIWTSKTR